MASGGAMRVAILHDWLVSMRGGEYCLEVLSAMFPEAEIYTLFYDRHSVSPQIARHRINVSPLGRLPSVRKYYRYLLPVYPAAAKSLEHRLRVEHHKRPYDLVISISHCAAKNIRTPEGLPHVCYCLTPVRYIWDQYARYFEGRPIEPLVRQVVKPLRRWDVAGSSGVDQFIGISRFVVERIERCYQRRAEVVYPPVRSDWLRPAAAEERGESYLCVNALVPYKNTDVIIRAFNELRYPLTIVGTGPEEARLKQLAGDTISFRGFVTREELAQLYRTTKALVFAAEEDFGMTPVEMQAAGGPVIAFGRGGVLETVVTSGKHPTGVFFDELAVPSVKRAVEEFSSRQQEFTVDNCLKQAQLFGLRRFTEDFERMLIQCGVAAERLQTRTLGSRS